MTESSHDEATERLGTSEHLDRALYVTTAKAWLALCVLVVMTAAVIVWAVFGEVATYVEAKGIFLSREGMVFDAASSGGGKLARIVSAVGDEVTKGDLVAEISAAETMERYLSAVALADERKRTLQERKAEAKAENALAAQNIANQRDRLEELERTGRAMVAKSRERLQSDRELLAQGIVDRMTVDRSEQAFELAQRNLFDALRRRDALEADDLRRRNALKASVTSAKADLLAAERQVVELAALIETWRIRAPVAGRVTEIKAQVGATLAPGQPVLSIETGGEGLDVLIYVPPVDGKRVEAGMPALVSPATARHEEFGYMIGTVEGLSEFPASLNGMIAVLQNQDLARTFSHGGPPYPGRVALVLDPSTTSGFAWTSPQAAGVVITPGTLATVEVVVSTQPPAALVVPWLRESLGL